MTRSKFKTEQKAKWSNLQIKRINLKSRQSSDGVKHSMKQEKRGKLWKPFDKRQLTICTRTSSNESIYSKIDSNNKSR